jgi:competence protein ComEC
MNFRGVMQGWRAVTAARDGADSSRVTIALPVRASALGFAGGTFWLQGQSHLPSGTLWLYSLLALVAALVLYRSALRLVFWPVAAALLAISYSTWRAEQRLAEELPLAWEGRDVLLLGRAASLPDVSDNRVRFAFHVDRVETATAVVPSKLLLDWYAPRGATAAALPIDIAVGVPIRLTVRLRRPHGLSNPGGFDYEAWLLEQGIRATGYVRGGGGALAEPSGFWIERWREGVRARLRAALGESPFAGVVIALAIGDQSRVSQAQWQLFATTGVTHLISISGLHVTMLAGLAYLVTSAMWRRSRRLPLWLPAQRAGALVGLAVATLYAALAGFSVPTQRTVAMLAVVAAAGFFGRMSSPSRVLALAAVLVLLWDPWAVNAPGFWLSFGACALIFFVQGGRLHKSSSLVIWLRVQAAITLGLAPATIALFGQVSLVGPFANAVAIPVISWAVAPLAVAACVPALDVLAPVAEWIFARLMPLLEALGRAPPALWAQHLPPAWSIVAALLAVLWLLAPRGIPGRLLALPLAAPLFFTPIATPPIGAMWMNVLDVGQGLAIVLRTQQHVLVYDTGPDYAGGGDAGQRVVLPYLRASGLTHIDTLVLSHDDSDHTGGATSVVAGLPPRRVLHSFPAGHPAATGSGAQLCTAGERWDWDGVTFEVLSPSRSFAAARLESNNAASCVVWVRSAYGSVLLPGDVERAAEARLVRDYGHALASTVTVAPHHGSGGASSAAFVAAVAPRWVIFSAGYRNRFGHPRADVLERYLRSGAGVLRTDADGAIDVRFDRDGVRVETNRMRFARYFHGR